MTEESPLRRLMSDSGGAPLESFADLASAQADPLGVVVLEGDEGGQIYVVARAVQVLCSQPTLHQLLADIDSEQWNDPSSARLTFERQPPGALVAGGMGGGRATEGIWVHDELHSLAAAIEAVLHGHRQRLRAVAG